MRIALGIEYCGTPYVGWQRQTNGLSVQQCVEEALSAVADHPVNVICAGRTDTGVHGICQVIHFDTTTQRDANAWVRGCNANLPKTISVIWHRKVSDEFHARFSAQQRYYRYVIYNRSIRPFFNIVLHGHFASLTKPGCNRPQIIFLVNMILHRIVR